MHEVCNTPCLSREEGSHTTGFRPGPLLHRVGALFAVCLALLPLAGCSIFGLGGPIFPLAVRRAAAGHRQAGATQPGQSVKNPLNSISSGVALTEPDPNATPHPLAAGTYQQFLIRQGGCSISRGLGSILDGTLDALYPNFQNDMRSVAQLTPNPLPSPYPNGCADSALGVAASPNFVIAGKLANGNYYGAEAGNTGIMTYLTSQLTSYVGSNIDTSNGSSTAFPARLAAADLNGDGVADLVVANYDYASNTGNNLSILLAHSDGSYGAVVQIPMLSSAELIESLTLADANGDGHPDLLFEALGTGQSFSLVVALGNGDGTFGPLEAVVTGPAYRSSGSQAGGPGLAAADLNGDGHIDLVDSGGFVFLGDGSGKFQQVNTTGLPGSGGSLAIADFNHDGKPDVAFTDTSANIVSIFFGNGDGTFTQGTTYATIHGPIEIAATDLDGDGNVDLAVGIAGAGIFGPGSLSGGISDYLLGRGDGTFAAPRTFLSNGGSVPVVADFNGDGKADVVEIAGTALNFAAGNGDGTFGQTQQAATIQAAMAGSFLLTADLNGDGKQDVLLVIPSTGQFTALLGSGNGTFPSATPLQTVGTGATPFLAELADFTGDGKPDLVVLSTVGTASTGLLSLLPGNGDGTFAAAQTIDSYGPTDGYGYNVGSQLATADLNRDGKPDLVIFLGGFTDGTNTYPPVANTYLNNGTGTFTGSPVPGVSQSATISGFGVGDVNGDGIPDLVLDQSGTVQFQGAKLLLGKGDGTFAAAAPVTLVSPAPNGPVSIQDLNNDGKADLFYQGYCPGAACGTIALGNGDGTFPTTLPVLIGFPTLVSTVDLNEDKLPDLVFAGFYGPIAVVLNNGFGSALATTTPPGATATTTTLTSSSATVGAGGSLTFTALVAPSSGSGIPTGSVAFFDGTTQIGSGTLDGSGKATYATSGLAAGTHSISAVYGGDTSYAASTSAPVVITVTSAAADFSISLAPASGTVSNGSSVTSSITITPANGFNQAVALSCSGAPRNSTCQVSPGSVTPGGSGPVTATLTVQAGVQATALAEPHTLGRAPGTIAWGLLAGGGLLGCVTLRRRRLWTQFLALSALFCGLIGVSTGCGGSNHTTPTGTYTITVTAVSGTDAHTASYSLSVK